MRTAILVLMITTVLCLTLVVAAQLPQKEAEQTQPARQLDPGFEEAHQQLYSPEDRVGQANRLTQTVASALPPGPASYEPLPHKNFVDDYILGRMEKEHIPHAPLANDAEFLRRTYLDATGLLPTADEARKFLNDKDPNKRDKLIDSLVGTDAFADQWAYHYGELFRTDDARFHLWTKQWIKVDRPYNDVFYDIVTASMKYAGSLPSAMYYDPTSYTNTRCVTFLDTDFLKSLNRLDMIDEITSDVGRVFLGLTMDCFSCHNGAGHADTVNLFLASKKRSDFWQQAAFFGKMRLIASGGFQNGNTSIDDSEQGYNTGDDNYYFTMAENRFPRDGKTYQPAFLLTGEKPKPGEEPRKALGRIMPTHIQFSRAAVNIVWQQLMVLGLVEPYDGFDLMRLDPKNPPPAPWTIQPSNPELLEALAKDFQSNGYHIWRTIKLIMKSNAYQLSTRFDGEWKDSYIKYHARRFARILTGPEAADIVAEATGVPYKVTFYGAPRSYVKELTNPVKMKDGVGENKEVFALMQAYYQSERALPPADKSLASPVQAMMMMSSTVVTDRVTADGKTRVANLLKSGKSDGEVFEELVLSTLSRFPRDNEKELMTRLVNEKGRTKAFEDITWVLMNNSEFLLNH
jgi:hypothetical protein